MQKRVTRFINLSVNTYVDVRARAYIVTNVFKRTENEEKKVEEKAVKRDRSFVSGSDPAVSASLHTLNLRRDKRLRIA